MFEAVTKAFTIPDIRRKLLFTLGILVIFRIIATIPVPGVNQRATGIHRRQSTPGNAQPVLRGAG